MQTSGFTPDETEYLRNFPKERYERNLEHLKLIESVNPASPMARYGRSFIEAYQKFHGLS